MLNGNQERSAFTLIELLIVTAILGVVIGAIGACLAGGINVWDSARTFNVLERDALIGLATVEKDLMNALPIHAIGFEGMPDSVKFPALLHDMDGIKVGSVEWSFDDLGEALVRRERSSDGADIRTEKLVEQVESVEMTYFSLEKRGEGSTGMTWKEFDGAVTNFPGKVELALLLSDGERDFEITRTILLPVK